jgi:drug/metabolite transporter (DMT)-like permease
LSTDWTGLPPVVYAGIFYLAVFTTAGTFFRVQFAAMRLPSGKVMAYVYLLPAIIAALLILSHNEDEEISKDWAAAGANVLFHAVVETAEIVE